MSGRDKHSVVKYTSTIEKKEGDGKKIATKKPACQKVHVCDLLIVDGVRFEHCAVKQYDRVC